MSKRIAIPSRAKEAPDLDHWVENQAREVASQPSVKPKRLTIDIDPELHTALKIHCATRQVPLADFVRNLITNALSSP